MHRIAYETITENNPKNLNEPLEFTINAINDRQYIDLYDSYITFDLNIHTDPTDDFKSEKPYVLMNNTAPGLIEQANISNIIYFEGDTIKNATFDSIRQAPDYRTLIRTLFTDSVQCYFERNDGYIPETIGENVEYNLIGVFNREYYFEKEGETVYSSQFKVPLRLLFEIANEENFINYKEITFKIIFKDPKKYMYAGDSISYSYTESGKTESANVEPVNITYDNVQIMYHYYQDLSLTEQPTIRNTPLQAFQFPSKVINSKNIIQKSLLMNDVYRYLMIFVTPNIESTALIDSALVSKITLGCQGKSFWTMNPTTDQLYDYLSYCINKPGSHSIFDKQNYHQRMPISLFPIDEIIEYEAPGFLDVNLEFPEPSYPDDSIVHLVFFGK